MIYSAVLESCEVYLVVWAGQKVVEGETQLNSFKKNSTKTKSPQWSTHLHHAYILLTSCIQCITIFGLWTLSDIRHVILFQVQTSYLMHEVYVHYSGQGPDRGMYSYRVPLKLNLREILWWISFTATFITKCIHNCTELSGSQTDTQKWKHNLLQPHWQR